MANIKEDLKNIWVEKRNEELLVPAVFNDNENDDL